MNEIDILTVFVASLIYLILSSFWYSSFLFGNIYKKLAKIPSKVVPNKFHVILTSFILLFIMSYFLALLEVLIGATSFFDGVILGLIIWFGFIGTTQLFLLLHYNRSFKLFILDNTLYLLGTMLVGGILAG